MKKVFLATAVVLALLVCLSVASFAASEAAYAATAPKIDGEIDDIWAASPAIECVDGGDGWIDGDSATGYAKILWDETGLYFLAVVTDYTPVAADDASCTNGANFWVSEQNTKADTFENTADGDYLYMISSNGTSRGDTGEFYCGDGSNYTVALSAVKENDSGYVVEVKVPWISKITPAAGNVIGFVLSIDDEVDGDGSRDSYARTANAKDDDETAPDNYWSATAALAEITLLEKTEGTGAANPTATVPSGLSSVFTAPSVYLNFDGSVSGVIVNGTEKYVAGAVGQALEFTENLYLTVPGLTFGADNFTVSFWFNNKTLDSDPGLFGNKDWDSGKNSGFVFTLRTEDFKFNVGYDGKDDCRFDSTYALPAKEEWHHFIFTVDRANGKVAGYLDFTEVSIQDLPATLAGIAFDCLDFNIGEDGTGHYGNSDDYILDDFIISKNYLDASAVASVKAYYDAAGASVSSGAAEDTTPVVPDNPTTADVSAIFYVISALSAVAGLTVCKRK